VSPCCKIREVLRELVTLRRQLVDQHTRLQNQLEHVTVPMVIDSIQRSIQSLKQELKAVQKHIQQQIDSDPALKQKQQKLRAAVGVGQIVSTVLVTELPELGTLHRNRIAALVGVAPYDDDSGQHRGKRAIYGGRSTVRSALYMATLVAIQRDQHTQDYYQRLLQRGKPKKVAIVACMHKRLNYFNSLIREPANQLSNCATTPPGGGAK
jgi:transposase